MRELTRRQLYALGEPLGECATRRDVTGRLILGGGGGSSSSSSSNTTSTTNIDRRQVVAEGGIGLASDGATINVETIDAGIVSAAIDAIKADDATNGAGFTQLLTLADHLFTGAGSMISKTQDTALGQIAALNTAQNDSTGKIDQKTLIVMAVAGVGALYLMNKKG